MPDFLLSPEEAVRALGGHRILVVGDLVLDEYLTGRPSRISREAPVLILDETEREHRAGSAGNPAANVVALGSHATIVGVIGDDDLPAALLAAGLEQAGIACDGLIRDASLPTSVKTRILAEGFTGGLFGRQQVLRIDRVRPLPAALAERCADTVGTFAATHDAVLLSDYRGGVVTAAVVQAALASGRPVAVDSQGDLRLFRGVDLLKVNQAEAHTALGTEDVMGHANALRQDLGVRALVVTLGADGMALFDDSGVHLVPAPRVTEVFDVTGAGDTVIAVLTLARIGGVPLLQAATLANAAASAVVRRLGVATATPAEILAAL